MATIETSGQQPAGWRRLLGIEPITSTPQRRSSLAAAALELRATKIRRSQINPEAWQQEAIELYSEVGELRYVANASANAASRAELYVGRFENSEDYPVRVDDGLPVEVWRAFGGGPLGRSELVKRLFIQLFVPGDGYVVGLPPGVIDDGDKLSPDQLRLSDLTWHVFAGTEIVTDDRELTIKLGDRVRKARLDDAIVVRVWRPNPFRWWQADSPVRSNLPILREIVGLTKHVSASIDSRLAGAGMLLIGDSFSVLAGQSPDADDSPESDPIMSALMDAMLTAIRDRDSAAAVMPIILQGPDDAVDKVRHLTFSTPFDSHTKELRDEAIRRLALGLDTPPEILLGLGSSTHWNAWIIQDDTIRTHVEPNLALICDALTSDYLWPMLESLGVPDARDYVIWWDTGGLTQRSDRSQEAIALFDRGEITGEALRRETGFADDDAPDDDAARKLVLSMISDNPDLIVSPGIPTLLAEIRELMVGNVSVEVDVEPTDDELTDVPDMPDTIAIEETPSADAPA